MTFKRKLSIAFSSVVLLTVIVALTNWWGIGSAIERQNDIFFKIAGVEEQFHFMVRAEQAYRSTEQISHAKEVYTIIENLKIIIQTAIPAEASLGQHEAIDNVMFALENYERNFSMHNSSIVDTQTMKSRILKESQKLLRMVEDLIGPENRTLQESKSSNLEIKKATIATRISYLTIKALLAEKNYILTGQIDAEQAVTTAISEIQHQTNRLKQISSESTGDLQAFRISKVTNIYSDIFNKFVSEQKKMTGSAIKMQNAQDYFSASLASFLQYQKNITSEKMASLQVLSFLISVLAIVIGIIAVVVLSNLITGPVNALKVSARNIVDGNLDTYVSISSNDDIGELGLLFNEMTSQLKKSFREINEYQDHLEELVKSRTEKLEAEIIDHQQTEEALRESSERLTNIITQSPMGIVIWDNDFRAKEWNASCEKIFGYLREDVLNKSGMTIVAEEDQQRISNLFDSLKNKKTVRNRNRNITKSGKKITCEWYNTPLTDHKDNVIGILSLVEDVTDQIHLEKELLKIIKLESTGVLAGGIAHDFNNILTAILGNINLSLLDTSLEPPTRKRLMAAEKASLRAQTLTQQLLTFSKGGEPVKEQTSIVEVIRDSADFVLHGSSTSCKYYISDDLWLIDADKGQISQVIQNIVLNASQSMPGGGQISITCENIDRTKIQEDLLSTNTDYIKITISDNGVGIPERTLEKIFDPYFSTKTEGSGLGLAITLSIVRKHKGHISAESIPDEGTTFTIFLPADSKLMATTLAEKTTTISSTVNATILIMDDEDMVLNVVSSMIGALGYETLLSKNGDECIELYSQLMKQGNPPDLIIMDLTIPGGKGGEETTKELLQIDPNVQVVVSSGYSNDPIMASFKEYGFCAAISKPYVMDDLSQVITKTLAA